MDKHREYIACRTDSPGWVEVNEVLNTAFGILVADFGATSDGDLDLGPGMNAIETYVITIERERLRAFLEDHDMPEAEIERLAWALAFREGQPLHRCAEMLMDFYLEECGGVSNTSAEVVDRGPCELSDRDTVTCSLTCSKRVSLLFDGTMLFKIEKVDPTVN